MMPCFCPAKVQKLSVLLPKANLSVSAVPPQLAQLASLLDVANGDAQSAARADLVMKAALPTVTSQAWFQATVSAAAPGLRVQIPNGGPPLMKLTARVAAVASSFPLLDPAALLADVKLAVRSMTASLLPISAQARAIPKVQLTNMVLAARLTLGLRAKGICPMALANVDASFSEQQSLGNPQSTLKAAVGASAQLKAQATTAPVIPPFAVPAPQLNLAISLAALAPLAQVPKSLALPAVSDPDFSAMAMNALATLVKIPPIPLDTAELFTDLSRLADLSAIQQAFGADAMTPAGVARVQAMLKFVAQLRLPVVPDTIAQVSSKLAILPKMDAVTQGASVAKTGAATFAAALNFKPALPPVLPLLEAINGLKLVLSDAIGTPITGTSLSCKFLT